MTGGFRTMPMISRPWVFAISPNHPLANMPEPLTAEQVKHHRAIAVGDTGRSMPTFSTGLLSGQETLTVPSLRAKLQAQLAGLGCGHLPIGLAEPHLASGALIEKKTLDIRPPLTKQIVWRTHGRGKCLKWFLNYLADPNVQASLADG